MTQSCPILQILLTRWRKYVTMGCEKCENRNTNEAHNVYVVIYEER
jgi:hypothetical protein